MGRKLLILISVLFSMSAMFTLAARADEFLVFSASFDDDAEAELWDGGIIDDADPALGKSCLTVCNPVGDEMFGRSSHAFSYNGTVDLEAGVIYRLSMYAKSLDPYADTNRGSGIRFGDGDGGIVFEFGGIPDKWSTVYQYFMVPDSGSYSFSVELKNGGTDTGFMADELTIESMDITPDILTIIGERSLTIPYSGEISSVYRLGAYSSGGDEINILYGVSTITARDLPAGVTFDGGTGTVTVNEYCPDNSGFTLECTPPDFLSLEPITAEVSLTRNIFRNSDFSDGDSEWLYSDGAINSDSSGSYLTLYPQSTPYGYQASLSPDYSAVLIEGAMYVLRARVRVDDGPDSSVYSRNTAVSRDGEVVIDILDLPSRGWIDVTAAFTPDASGIYAITMNFTIPTYSSIDVANVTLSPEQPEETYITLHAPGNISIPDSSTTFPFSAYIRDQAGEIISDNCAVTIYPEKNGVSLTQNGLLVSPDAAAGEYELRAVSNSNSSMTASLSFTLSYSNVGDGGFEERRINEWWTAAAPAAMTIEADGGKYAHITSDEDFAIVLNNSYMRLYANRPYAFKSDVRGRGQTVTAFIETVGGDRVPLIQSDTDGGEIFELFQTDEELVGRLLLYISSDRGVSLDIDNIELFRAMVWVTAPIISGIIDSGAMVEASFSFFNNLDDSADPSDCVVSWYSQDPDTGESEYLGGGISFTVPASASGKYLYCEVTPICKVTGLSGAPMKSVPVMVGVSIEYHGGENTTVVPPDTGNEPAFPTLTPVVLEAPSGDLPFTDTEGHWAEEEISALYHAGIVTGVDSRSFNPAGYISRGELAAMICRAFGASGGRHGFYDVSPDSWYGKYVASVYALGIMDGTSDTAFSPDAPVSRELLAVTLVRVYEALGYTAPRSTLSWFYDSNDISGWAEDGVAKGVRIGLVNGTPNMTFAPKRGATRAEACVMMVRLLDAIRFAEENE